MKALKGQKKIAQGKRNKMSAALGLRPTKHSFSHRMGEGGPALRDRMRVEENSMNRYEMIVWWSAEDGAYVVDVPELPGCMAHGPTRQDAIKN